MCWCYSKMLYAIVSFGDTKTDFVPTKWTADGTEEIIADTTVKVFWPPWRNNMTVSHANRQCIDAETGQPAYDARIWLTAGIRTKQLTLCFQLMLLFCCHLYIVGRKNTEWVSSFLMAHQHISSSSLNRVLYVSILCDSNFKFWFSAERLWLLNLSVKFSLEESSEKVCARVLVMSGIDVISWPLTERW